MLCSHSTLLCALLAMSFLSSVPNHTMFSPVAAVRVDVAEPHKPIDVPILPARSMVQIDAVAVKRHRGRLGSDDKESFVSKCYQHGKELLSLLDERSIPKQNKTAFTKYEQLASNGWTEKAVDLHGTGEVAETFRSIGKVLQALKVSDQPDSLWQGVRRMRSQASGGAGGDGDRSPASDASYVNIINRGQGVIVVTKSSPPSVAKPGPSTDKLVPLQRWSDVTFLTWQHLARTPKEMLDIKHIMFVSITDIDTRAVIQAFAPRYSLDRMPCWPGMNVDPRTLQGRVLLGSPVGDDVTLFLAQHKGVLGARRHVTKITVWVTGEGGSQKGGDGADVCMLFTISEVTNVKSGS